MKPGVIVSMEQALALPYATLRFVHLGWRVIRVEPTQARPGALPGDPNRYIGSIVEDEGRRSYFVAPNVGKEAIALNLKTPEGREALKRVISGVGADVFCCNTIPSRYAQLGVDYETLRAVKPDLIWAAISAMGPEFPDAAGYDPAIQAMAGFMEVTGMADGPPTLSGIPLVDLKAGDEVYAHVWMALAERLATGQGRRIDVSMLQAAASWLITVLPLVDFGCDYSEITRCGNEHRKFVPTNAYPTRDGVVLVAIGSDALWQRLTGIDRFRGLASEQRATNAGRLRDRDAIHRDIAAVTRQFASAEIVADLKRAAIPHAPINTIPEVMEMPAVASKLTRTRLADGRTVRMQPMAVDNNGASDGTSDGIGRDFAFPPSYSQHTWSVLREVGYRDDDLRTLAERGVVPEAEPGSGAA